MTARWLPLLGVLAYGVAFAAAAIGAGPPVFDDHPGQLYRLVHVVTAGWAPWRWNDGWWTGYPELQFYPPGFFYLGALVHTIGAGTVPVTAVYTALAWLTYLAPAMTVFALLARVLGNGWAALPGAFLALTLSAGLSSGVEGGVHIGMLPARLGWALLPLVALALGGWLEGGHRPPWGAAPLVAAVVVTHPAHAPAAVLLVVVAAWLGDGDRRRRLGVAAAVLVLTLLLTAFWTAPLLARLEHARPLAWGQLSLADIGRHPLLVVLVVVAALGLRARFGPLGTALVRLPWLMAALVLLDVAVLAPLGVRWLPGDRLADSAWLGVVIAAGLVAGRLILGTPGPPAMAPPLRSLGVVAALATLSLIGGTLSLWPRAALWPTHDSTVRGLRLDALWADLRVAPSGRVLFVRSAVPLVFGGGEWWRPHSHIPALTPLVAGRPIVNGTFTHPSPVAALLYRGSPAPGPVTTLVERLDGQSLFGRPLEALGDGGADHLARLGVSVVVALDEDAPRLRALHDSAAFRPRPPLGPFLSWWRSTPLAAPVAAGPGRWAIALDGDPGTWVSARVMEYPLWQAWRDGERLATRRGPAWDLEVRLNAGRGPVELVYGAGWIERLGVTVSVLAATLWVAAARPSRRRR